MSACSLQPMIQLMGKHRWHAPCSPRGHYPEETTGNNYPKAKGHKCQEEVQIKSFQNAEELTVDFGGTEGSEDLIKVTFVLGFEGFQ